MKLFAALSAALALGFASPAMAQEWYGGSVTYTITGMSPYPGATSVTVNYSAETITWHMEDGFDFTEGDPNMFTTHATMLANMYGPTSGKTPRTIDDGQPQ